MNVQVLIVYAEIVNLFAQDVLHQTNALFVEAGHFWTLTTNVLFVILFVQLVKWQESVFHVNGGIIWNLIRLAQNVQSGARTVLIMNIVKSVLVAIGQMSTFVSYAQPIVYYVGLQKTVILVDLAGGLKKLMSLFQLVFNAILYV